MQILLDYLGLITSSFSTNPVISGFVMLFLNVGTGFLMQDISPVVQNIFKHKWLRRLVFFAIFFTATRQLLISIGLTIICTLLLDYFFNAQSHFYILGNSLQQRQEREHRFRRNLLVLNTN